MADTSRSRSPRRVLPRSALVEAVVELLRPLLSSVCAELRVREARGELPPGAVTAEEVVDAALVEALRNADEAPAEGLYPWLRSFVRRAIAREVADARRKRRERSLEEPVGTGWPDEEGWGSPRRLIDILPDPKSPIPEDVVASAEFQRALADILYQLPERWREPLLMRAFDGVPLPAIARTEGVSVAEVRRRIELAREFLRARLAEEYEELPVPPGEMLFAAAERVDPTPEHEARVRDRLEPGAA